MSRVVNCMRWMLDPEDESYEPESAGLACQHHDCIEMSAIEHLAKAARQQAYEPWLVEAMRNDRELMRSEFYGRTA